MRQLLLISRKALYATVLITLLALWFMIPNFWNCSKHQWLPRSSMNLGLDLQGGVYLLLQLDIDTYLMEQLSAVTETLRKELRNSKIGYKSLAIKHNAIVLELRNITNYNLFKDILSNIDRDLVLRNQDNNKLEITFSEQKYTSIQDTIIYNSIEVLRSRIDSTGVSEPSIRRQGQNNIALEVPGIEDPKLLKSLITKIAKLTFNIVVDNDVKSSNRDIIKVKGYHNPEHSLLVHKQPVIRGDLLQSASVSFNNFSQPCVAFSFNSLGKKLLANVTTENKGKRLAIILDGKLLSAPVVNEPILGGEGIISGNFTIESASELSLLLKSGSLPTTIDIVEERSIGPSLGKDLIHASKIAGYVGFMLVSLLMLIVYGTLGIVSALTLVIYLIYMIAMLSALGVTLTLHGIAGIILTIGMAVDANILIFERIREELNIGCSLIQAIRNGFKLSATAIIDSNITTLLISLVLYIFGTGAFRGFGVVLAIGVLCSMYSSIVVTRILIGLWIRCGLPIKFVNMKLNKKY